MKAEKEYRYGLSHGRWRTWDDTGKLTKDAFHQAYSGVGDPLPLIPLVKQEQWEEIEAYIYELSFTYPYQTVLGFHELIHNLYETLNFEGYPHMDEFMTKIFPIVMDKWVLEHLQYGSTDLSNFDDYLKLYSSYWKSPETSFSNYAVGKRQFYVRFFLVLVECAYSDSPDTTWVIKAVEELGDNHFLVEEVQKWTSEADPERSQKGGG